MIKVIDLLVLMLIVTAMVWLAGYMGWTLISALKDWWCSK